MSDIQDTNYGNSQKFGQQTTPTVYDMIRLLETARDAGLGNVPVFVQDNEANAGAGKLVNIYNVFYDGSMRIVLGNIVSEI